MAGAPGERRHSHVHIVASVLADLQYGSHIEARTCVRVILNRDVRSNFLYSAHNLAKAVRTSDARHILQTYFICSRFYELFRQADVIFHSVNRGVGDAEAGLGNHPGFLRVSDGRNDVARVVQTAENTGYIGALGLLHLIEKLAQVLGARAHSKAVERAVQHLGLDAGFP